MKHMEPVLRKKWKTKKLFAKKIREKYGKDQTSEFKLEDADFTSIVTQMKQYVKFKTSILTRLCSSYLPPALHTPRARADVKLIQKFH
jgi:hypothetical protein